MRFICDGVLIASSKNGLNLDSRSETNAIVDQNN